MTAKQDKIKKLASSVTPAAIKERKYRKVHKRKTDEDDYERLGRNLWIKHGESIVDRVTFEDAYKKYVGSEEIGDNTSFIDKVWKEVKDIPGVNETPLTPVIKPAKDTKRPVFDVLGKVKGVDRFLRITHVTVRGKKVIRFRDKLGRFGSPKKS